MKTLWFLIIAVHHYVGGPRFTNTSYFYIQNCQADVLPFCLTHVVNYPGKLWVSWHKTFYPYCVANSGHCNWHIISSISILLGAPLLVHTNQSHLGLSQPMRRVVHCGQYTSVKFSVCECVLLLSSIPAGLFFQIIWCTSLWSKLLYYTIWKKVGMNGMSPSESPLAEPEHAVGSGLLYSLQKA